VCGQAAQREKKKQSLHEQQQSNPSKENEENEKWVNGHICVAKKKGRKNTVTGKRVGVFISTELESEGRRKERCDSRAKGGAVRLLPLRLVEERFQSENIGWIRFGIFDFGNIRFGIGSKKER